MWISLIRKEVCPFGRQFNYRLIITERSLSYFSQETLNLKQKEETFYDINSDNIVMTVEGHFAIILRTLTPLRECCLVRGWSTTRGGHWSGVSQTPSEMLLHNNTKNESWINIFLWIKSWSIKNWKPRKTLYFFASGYLTKNSHEHWRDKHISPMCVLLCNMLRTTPTLSIFFLFYNLRNHCSC